jgi:hypothetical protein
MGIAILYLFFEQHQLNTRIEKLSMLPEVEEIELAHSMGRFQLYANKLWFSGKEGNWSLAGFYVHEIEENMEEIEASSLVENGQNVSELIRSFGLEPLSEVSTAIEKKEIHSFELAYENMLTYCNACHVATGKPYIKIKTPETPTFDNQIYTP